ncbi:hypothetical protein NAPIS_ORF01994 [Vairimorpha apis BRL 01]|uniref:Uncharacterized protein n=1 Tax=Vairimorpha apis BRL 01 TaxID=1037528 RepID=T0MHL8_9MICR|nr:hypothetical protein NAPIS_ORF01994 [Vairimorpha apis BRL 01]
MTKYEYKFILQNTGSNTFKIIYLPLKTCYIPVKCNYLSCSIKKHNDYININFIESKSNCKNGSVTECLHANHKIQKSYINNINKIIDEISCLDCNKCKVLGTLQFEGLKACILKSNEKKILISKKNIKNDIICYDYKDETSCLVIRKEEYKNICILDIPKSFYFYFIGKSGVMKLKYEYEYNVDITEISTDSENFTILVDGNGKEKFRIFVLDLIYK